jgi:transposase
MYVKYYKVKRGGKVWEYAKLVEGYREGGKVKHQILKNLGPVRSEADRKRFQEMAKGLRPAKRLVWFEDLKIEGVHDFGIVYTVEKLWDAYGISQVLNEAFSDGRFEFDATKIVRLLVAHRLHQPSSDLAAFDWIKRRAFVDTEAIGLQHVYRTLDQLIKRKDRIETAIFKELQRTLGLKVDIVFYDLTSTYFEGEGPELAKYGYSRDHRPDRKQLVLALAMIDGIPIAHEVFEGNTADRTTLRHAVVKLKEKFDIKRIIFVADRGLFSEENLDFLDEEEYEFIIATKRRWNKEIEKLMLTPIEARGRVFAKEVKREGNRRYILCINRDTEREERKHLRELRRSLERKLKELSDSWAMKGAGRRPSKENVLNKAMRVLGRHKRLFDLKFDNGLRYSLNRETWKYENAIAGRFLLVTTSDLAAKRAMESYRELRMVEQAFREIKHFVDIRPIFHFEDDMVRAHVFVCVLAYLTEALIGRLVPYQSARRTIQELREINVVKLVAKGCKGVFMRGLTESDRTLFKSLGVPISERIMEI